MERGVWKGVGPDLDGPRLEVVRLGPLRELAPRGPVSAEAEAAALADEARAALPRWSFGKNG